MGKSQKKSTGHTRFFFQKRATDCFIQNQFYNYIGNQDNRSFFTELKQTYDKLAQTHVALSGPNEAASTAADDDYIKFKEFWIKKCHI